MLSSTIQHLSSLYHCNFSISVNSGNIYKLFVLNFFYILLFRSHSSVTYYALVNMDIVSFKYVLLCFTNRYLTGNPCADFEGYKQYVIANLPQIKVSCWNIPFVWDSLNHNNVFYIKVVTRFKIIKLYPRICGTIYISFQNYCRN